MNPALAVDLLHCGREICAQPTAPYFEQHVRARLRALLSDQTNLSWQEDEFGNIRVTYRHRPLAGRAYLAVAHMDHPGFVALPAGKSRATHAEFRGGVAQSYFPNQTIAWFSAKGESAGFSQILDTDWRNQKQRVYLDQLPSGAVFGMWHLPAVQVKGGKFHSRACDDLIGTSTLCALLRRLARERARAEVHVLFSRAEEVGFHGSLAHLHSRLPLPGVPILSIETSNAQGFAQMGDGPILRVGDRSSVFDSCTTAWLSQSFESMQKAGLITSWQKRLMAGGTCEGTVFARRGLAAGALCVGLENYHNMAARNQIRPEAISLRDWQGLFDFLFYLATQAQPFARAEKALEKYLGEMERTARRELPRMPL